MEELKPSVVGVGQPIEVARAPMMTDKAYAALSRRYRIRKARTALAFLAPYLALWSIFMVVPVAWSLVLTFREGGLIGTGRFVGIDNWQRAIGDDRLRQAIVNTSVYSVLAITIVFVLAIMLASILNKYRSGSNFFKLAFYIPILAPPILAAMIWMYLIHWDFGAFNLLIRSVFGGEGVNFRGSNPNALLTIVGVEVWRGLGFWVLFWLAGLQSVPGELIDAAQLDGARRARRFRRIVMPTLKPLMLFAVVIAIIFNYQVFEAVQVITQGGPEYGTATIVWMIFQRMFSFQDAGIAYAASFGLLIVILLMTFLSFRVLRKSGGDSV